MIRPWKKEYAEYFIKYASKFKGFSGNEELLQSTQASTGSKLVYKGTSIVVSFHSQPYIGSVVGRFLFGRKKEIRMLMLGLDAAGTLPLAKLACC